MCASRYGAPGTAAVSARRSSIASGGDDAVDLADEDLAGGPVLLGGPAEADQLGHVLDARVTDLEGGGREH